MKGVIEAIREGTMEEESRTSWLFLLDWGVVALTLTSAGASAFAALIAFGHDDASAMGEAVLAFGAALGAAWLGRMASRAAKRWQAELVAWHGNDIVLLLDGNRRILDANDRAAEAFGRPLDDLFHREVGVLRHPDAADRLDAHLGELRSNGRALFETTLQRRDGAPFPAEVSARVVSMRGRTLLHLIVRDSTDAHGARTRLVAAERLAAVGAVAAGMAHDINNPLCSVLGNLSFAAESLQDPVPDLAEVRQALGEAMDSARRVRDLIRDLNAFANGFGDGEGPADLSVAIDEAVAATRELTRSRCRVSLDVPSQARVAAPARRLSHVFTAILQGAARAIPEGQPSRHTIRIVARTSSAPRGFLVEVSDDGPPIHGPDGAVPRDPFSGEPQVARGGGAGLHAVMGMVRAVGGDVIVESAAGRGNVVRVLLPAAVSPADGTPAPFSAAQRSPMRAPTTPSA
ncbi:MAG: HAMP domain-containing sensor histidine kinase [Anaeromyxobacteraceae bacterium]